MVSTRMAFVHSLVRAEGSDKPGWCAPVELGEAAPHYVSFVVPIDENREFLSRYTCETVLVAGEEKRRQTHELLFRGQGSFVLPLGGNEIWFALRPVANRERRLPYVGKLIHADFERLLTEIEPEEPRLLDRLYDEQNTFVIGCEPFSHYAGIERLTKSHTP